MKSGRATALPSPSPRIEPTGERDAKYSEILEWLRSIDARLARIEARENKPNFDSDKELLAALLPAIGGKWGSEAWKVAEITGDPVLSALLMRMNRKKIGKLLARSTGKNIDGYSLERIGDERGTALWRVVKVL